MPIYLFKCQSCSSTFEMQLKISGIPDNCPVCHAGQSNLEKLPTTFATTIGSKPVQQPEIVASKTDQPCRGNHDHSSQNSHVHSKHDGHASCKKGYIDKMIQRYEKSIK